MDPTVCNKQHAKSYTEKKTCYRCSMAVH